jgi:hypothetical protein
MNVAQSNRKRHRTISAVLAVLFLGLLLFGLPFVVLSDDTLFEPVSDPTLTTLDIPDEGLRARVVRVNWSALSPRSDEVHLNLFPNVTFIAHLQRVDTSLTGAYVWVGELRGESGSTTTLAVQDGVLSGSIHRFGREWAVIEYVGGESSDLYTITQIDPDAPEPTGPDHVVPQLTATDIESYSTQSATCQEDGSEISVLIAYTAEARDAAGGTEAMQALINRRISEMNTANDVSQVNFDWKLAQVMQVDYVESGNIALDLQNLQQKADGVMDGVHVMRDGSKADLVSLLISEGNNSACGFAYQMNTLAPYYEAYAFGVTALDYADPFSCSELTLTHELGHNLGNAHDRAHANGAVLFPYSYGFQSPNNTFRTLMSYDCPGGCDRINQWSNPNVWYQGEPTGTDYALNPANASDVARSMNQARTLVSNFRADCFEPSPTATSTATDVPIATDTPIATPTATSTPIPTNTGTPTPTVTLTATNTATATMTPPGPTAKPTKTPKPTATPRPTRTGNPTPTSEPNTVAHSVYLPGIVGR